MPLPSVVKYGIGKKGKYAGIKIRICNDYRTSECR